MARRLSAEQWSVVRQKYETDPRFSFADLASMFGVSKQAIHARAKSGGWKRVVSEHELAARAQARADRLLDAKVDANALAQMREAGMSTATERRAAVVDRHRKEVDGPRKIAYQALHTRDIETARLAKTVAEALKVVQELERKAWGLDVAETPHAERTIIIDRS